MGTNVRTGDFVGEYIKKMELAILTGAVSKEVTLLIGAPGWGKTALATAVLHKIFGKDKTHKIEFEASTQPEEVKGIQDMKAYLVDHEFKMNMDNTPQDPRFDGFILDEFGRPMDAIFDHLIHTFKTDDAEKDQMPCFVCTANFLPISTRTEACFNRIAVVSWVDPDVSLEDVAAATINRMGRSPEVGNGLPDKAKIEDVIRLSNNLTDRAKKAVLDVVYDLVHAAAGMSVTSPGMEEVTFDLNPRNIVAWVRIFSRMSVYYTGTNDFDIVPSEARAVAPFLYQNFSLDQYKQWETIAKSIADPVQLAVDEIMRVTYNAVKTVLKSNPTRVQLINMVGTPLTQALSNLAGLDNADPRIQNAVAEVQEVYKKLVRGENPFPDDSE